MSLFEGRDLICQRGDRLVFAGLDFALPAGGALLLLGANGSGKSSLLRLMAGLAKPAGGELLWEDERVAADLEAHHGRLQFVGHLDAVKPVLSVAENLAFWAGLRDGGKARVGDALERLGLSELAPLPARLLSAGQRRRLALARLLVAPAALWLLDEPTVGLDRDSVARLTEAIGEHQDRGGRVVIATHLPLSLADTIELSIDDFAVAPAADSLDDAAWAAG